MVKMNVKLRLLFTALPKVIKIPLMTNKTYHKISVNGKAVGKCFGGTTEFFLNAQIGQLIVVERVVKGTSKSAWLWKVGEDRNQIIVLPDRETIDQYVIVDRTDIEENKVYATLPK